MPPRVVGFPLWYRYGLLAIVAVAIAIRMLAAVQWHPSGAEEEELFRLGDSYSYWVLAEQLGQGLPYQYGSENASIFRAPLYPLVLAPFTWNENKSQAVLHARLLGCLLGGVAVFLVSLLAARIGGGAAGLCAAALVTFYPSAIGMSIVLLSEAIFIPLMLLYLWLWLAAWNSDSLKACWPAAVASGVVAGLAVLSRPSWLLFLPMLTLTGFLLGGNRRRHLEIAVLCLIGLVITMSPWWVRNASVTGKFVPTTLQVGPSLYDGLHAGATGSSDEGMDFMREILDEQLMRDAQSSGPVESTLEWRLNRLAFQKAIDWARENPAAVGRLALAKLAKTWSLWPDGGQLGSPAVRAAVTISCCGIVLLALAWTWCNWRSWDWFSGICWLPCIYFSLLHMLFVGSIRYREPAIVVLCVLAGCFLGSRWRPHITPIPTDRRLSKPDSEAETTTDDAPADRTGN